MRKKLITSSILSLSIIVISAQVQTDILFAQGAELKISAEELNAEISQKDLKISAQEAINIAQQSRGKRAIAMRLRRLKNEPQGLGYAVALFGENAVSYETVVIHATTGKILASGDFEDYPVLLSVDTPDKLRVMISAQELKNEIQEAGLKLSAQEAIKIAEEREHGQAVSLRLRRLPAENNKGLGYGVIFLDNTSVTLEAIVIDGNTGEVLSSSGLSVFPITSEPGKLM